MIALEDLRAAEALLRRYFPPTPLLEAPRLSEKLGTELWLKLDSVTPIRTFKLRGALVKVDALVRSGHGGGVITASAGNHGLAVARAARWLERPATVCVPAAANPQKVALIAREGAEVVLVGRDYQEAFEEAERRARTQNLALVHAYDDPAVITGQGTIALELAGGRAPLEAVFVGVGGGGLISGLGVGFAALGLKPRLFGAQPAGADSMIRSLEAGRVTAIERVDTIADGLGARRPGEHTLALTRQHVEKVLRVSDAQILDAAKKLLLEERLVAEPAGAAGLAALISMDRKPPSAVVVVSGANISDAVLARITV